MGLIWRAIFGNRFVMLAIGVIALGAGIWLMNRVDVACGSESMQPGDTCDVTRRGTTHTYTYDERKSDQQLSGKIVTGVGGALTAGGLVWIVVAARRKPEPEAASVVA